MSTIQISKGMKVAIGRLEYNPETNEHILTEVVKVDTIKTVWKNGRIFTLEGRPSVQYELTTGNQFYGKGRNFDVGLVLKDEEVETYQAAADEYTRKVNAQKEAKRKEREEQKEREEKALEELKEKVFNSVENLSIREEQVFGLTGYRVTFTAFLWERKAMVEALVFQRLYRNWDNTYDYTTVMAGFAIVTRENEKVKDPTFKNFSFERNGFFTSKDYIYEIVHYAAF